MASIQIGNQGQAVVSVPATGSIAVWSQGTAQVFQTVGYPNHPDALVLLGTVNSGQTIFGPFTSATTITVNAGSQGAFYEAGISPQVEQVMGWQIQAAPVAVDVTGAVSASAILGGLVTSTTAAAVAGTVPTGTVMDAAANMQINDAIDWSVIATGANAFTVTAASGHTLVGTAVVATLTSGHFRTRKTAAATYVTYRVG